MVVLIRDARTLLVAFFNYSTTINEKPNQCHIYTSHSSQICSFLTTHLNVTFLCVCFANSLTIFMAQFAYQEGFRTSESKIVIKG